jgi:hypothetical protein
LDNLLNVFNPLHSLLLDGWGFLGIWLTHFGFKNVWEVWCYQVCSVAFS